MILKKEITTKDIIGDPIVTQIEGEAYKGVMSFLREKNYHLSIESIENIIGDIIREYWNFVESRRTGEKDILEIALKIRNALANSTDTELAEEYTLQIIANETMIITLLTNNFLTKYFSGKCRLTGLYNYDGFREDLPEIISRFTREERHAQEMNIKRNFDITCCFLDMVGLKAINDKYGNEEGNNCLRLIAEAINMSVRKTTKKYRYGGDEFLIIDEVTEDDHKNDYKIEKIISRINTKLEELVIQAHQNGKLDKNITTVKCHIGGYFKLSDMEMKETNLGLLEAKYETQVLINIGEISKKKKEEPRSN